MKIAISVPDPIFEVAERASKRLKISRSQLYAQAVEEYVRKHGASGVTDRLNAVYSEEPSDLDPLLEAMSLEVLRRETW